MKILYSTLLLIELGLVPVVFLLLLFITAPYGRFNRKGWGAVLPSRIAWILMESPSLVIPFVLVITSGFHGSSILFLFLWQIHYFHRTLIYPFRISDPNKPFSLLIMSWGFLFNLMNSTIVFYSVTTLQGPYSLEWFYQWRLILGFLLFGLGYVINKHSDAILRRLRSDGSKEYRIPEGGLYRWVSSPNYLGEIVEWGGWALMTWSWAGTAFFLFTIANLFPRALKNHKWYQSTFTHYPLERKAIIPFLW